MENLAPLMTSKSSLWRTPQWLFDKLDREFHFELDACADADNTLCAYYYDEETDGLQQAWYGNVYCNFPYDNAAAWVEKAYREAQAGHCTAVLLMPARTDTRYFWDYVRHGEIRFLPGRLKFQGGQHSAPFPSCVVIFHKGLSKPPCVKFWNIRSPKP
jgi:phage N-6-adenine-methyltransferase